MSGTFSRLYQGLIFKREGLKFYPIFSLLILVLQFYLLIIGNQLLLGIVLFISISENIMAGNLKGILNTLRAILGFLLLIGIITALFSSLENSFLIVSRLTCGTVIFSFLFAVTNPADLTRSLEDIKIPSKIAIIPSLSLSLVPRIAQDAQQVFETLTFRGVIAGRNPLRWLPRTIAIFLAAVIYRSDFVAQSLYYRGFNITKRSHFKKVRPKIIDGIRLIFWLMILVVTLE